MTPSSYPVFLESQVLTHLDLNGLRTYFDLQHQFLARMFGFGVACGLEGRIENNQDLHISAGWAFAKEGVVLARELEFVRALEAIQSVGLNDPFRPTRDTLELLDQSQPGFSAILVGREKFEESEGPCTEDECRRQSQLVHLECQIVFAPGRIMVTPGTFSPVLELRAIELSGSAAILKGRLQERLDEIRSLLLAVKLPETFPQLAEPDIPHLTQIRSRLNDISLANDLATLKSRVDQIHRVIYLFQQYAICHAYEVRGCEPESASSEVILGWVHQEQGTWEWNCSFRQSFQLSKMLYRAIHGSNCGSRCRRHLDELLLILTKWELPPEPDAPESEEPPKTPFCKRGLVWDPQLKACVVASDFPILDPTFRPGVPYPIPFPFPNFPQPRPPILDDPGIIDPLPYAILRDELNTRVDITASGTLHIGGALGHARDVSLQAIRQEINRQFSEPANIRSVELRDFEPSNIPGFEYSSIASPSDQIVLLEDDRGRVAATGVVRVNRSIGQLGQTLESSKASVQTVQKLVTDMAELESGLASGQTLADLGKVTEVPSMLMSMEEKLTRDITNKLQLGLQANISQEISKSLSLEAKDLNTRMDRQNQAVLSAIAGVSRGTGREWVSPSVARGMNSDLLESLTLLHTVNERVVESRDPLTSPMRDEVKELLGRVAELIVKLKEAAIDHDLIEPAPAMVLDTLETLTQVLKSLRPPENVRADLDRLDESLGKLRNSLER